MITSLFIIALSCFFYFYFRQLRKASRAIIEDTKHSIYTELLYRSYGRHGKGALSKYSTSDLEGIRAQLIEIVKKKRNHVALSSEEKKIIKRFPNSFAFAKLKH